MPDRDEPGPAPLAPFDLTSGDWVLVSGAGFFFEPLGAEFAPPERGAVVVAFGGDESRHRGIEVSTLEDGWVSIWMPVGSTAYWLPDSSRDDAPWETHLLPLDYERGQLT